MSKEREVDQGEYAASTRRSVKRGGGSSRDQHQRQRSSSSSSAGAVGNKYISGESSMQQQQQQHAGGGGGGGGVVIVTPCAACKLLRRRCAQECPFAPYFSPLEPHKFASVHKIYGASNVSKMLLEVPESQRADTTNSLVYEANARIRDPVYGCMGVISTLQQQARSLQAELNAVKAEVMRYRASHAENAANLNLMQMAAAGAAMAPPFINTATNNTVTHSSNPSLPGDHITYNVLGAPSTNSATSADSSVKAERFWSTLG